MNYPHKITFINNELSQKSYSIEPIKLRGIYLAVYSQPNHHIQSKFKQQEIVTYFMIAFAPNLFQCVHI